MTSSAVCLCDRSLSLSRLSLSSLLSLSVSFSCSLPRPRPAALRGLRAPSPPGILLKVAVAERETEDKAGAASVSSCNTQSKETPRQLSPLWCCRRSCTGDSSL